MHKNIARVGYTLDTDLPFCHLCMTAVHEAKWLSSTKKARPSLPYQVSFAYRKEATAVWKKYEAIIIANVTRKQMKLSICFPNKLVI